VINAEQFKKIGAYGPGVAAYVFGLSLINIWTYWRLFGIDVLEWIDLGDVLKLGLASLTIVFVGSALAALMIWIVLEPIIGRPFLIEEWDKDDRRGLLKWIGYAFEVLLFGLGVVLLFATTATIWGAASLAGAILLAARRMAWLRALVPGRRPRTLLVVLFGFAPVLAFGWALRAYVEVVSGERYTYIDAGEARQAGAVLPGTVDGELKIIGMVHDRMALLKDSLRAEDREVFMVALSSLNTIRIHRGVHRVPTGFWTFRP
jgi:hypothetical protein